MAEYDLPELCAVDGFVMGRDFHAEHASKHTCGNWPMESDAAGVGESQVDEAMKHATDNGVPTEFNRDTGAAIFTSQKHRKKYCELIGMYDRNASYGDPEPKNK